jgi:NADP-dependent 3-hydroxy acid dehydrogenase YdfG
VTRQIEYTPTRSEQRPAGRDGEQPEVQHLKYGHRYGDGLLQAGSTAKAIARTIAFAVEQPSDVDVSAIVIRPIRQQL